MKILNLSKLSFKNDLFPNGLPRDCILLLMTDKETKIKFTPLGSEFAPF